MLRKFSKLWCGRFFALVGADICGMMRTLNFEWHHNVFSLVGTATFISITYLMNQDLLSNIMKDEFCTS